MSFTEIVSRVAKRVNQTSATALTRIGEEVNDVYKRVTTAIGLNVSRHTEVQANASIGSQLITFEDIEKVLSVIDKSSGRNRFLDEVSTDEIDRAAVTDSDSPTKYAIYRCYAGSVKIKTNANAQTAYTLYAPGLERTDTLSGSQEPAIAESFHDIIYHGALEFEYLHLEKPALAKVAKESYEDRMGDLRIFIAKSPQQDIYQGKAGLSTFAGSTSSGSGGSSINGSTSYTQTGLITFDRTGAAPGSRNPFAVAVGSEKVANLDADKLDGLDSTAFALATHHTRHESGGADAIKLDDLATPDDNTDLNVSTVAHGLAPKLPNDATKFLDGTGNYTAPQSGLDVLQLQVFA